MRPIRIVMTGAITSPVPLDTNLINFEVEIFYSGAGTVQRTTDDLWGGVAPTNWTNVALVGGRTTLTTPSTAIRVTGGAVSDVLQVTQQGTR